MINKILLFLLYINKLDAALPYTKEEIDKMLSEMKQSEGMKYSKWYTKNAKIYHPDQHYDKNKQELKANERKIKFLTEFNTHIIDKDYDRSKTYEEVYEMCLKDVKPSYNANAYRHYNQSRNAKYEPEFTRNNQNKQDFKNFNQRYQNSERYSSDYGRHYAQHTKRQELEVMYVWLFIMFCIISFTMILRFYYSAKNTKHTLFLSKKQMKEGGVFKINVTKKKQCESCKGECNYGNNLVRCSGCIGYGYIYTQDRYGVSYRACNACLGSGRICNSCDSSGRVDAIETIEVEVPMNSKNNDIIYIKHKGDGGKNNYKPGDLIITICDNKEQR